MREFADLYGFESRSEKAFDFKQFVRGLEWFIDNARCSGRRQGGTSYMLETLGEIGGNVKEGGDRNDRR